MSRTEGRLAKSIERQTAKLPSDTFLWAALGSMGVSAVLQATGKRHASLFVGQWAPAFLLLGVYNKLVKQLGSDPVQSGIGSVARPRARAIPMRVRVGELGAEQDQLRRVVHPGQQGEEAGGGIRESRPRVPGVPAQRRDGRR